MKKYRICFLVMVMLTLSSCGTVPANETSSKNYPVSSENVATDTNKTSQNNDLTSSSKSEKSDTNNSITKESETLKINVDLDKIKMYYQESNNAISGIKKEYITDKKSQTQKYKKTGMSEKTLSFLGEEFKNLKYDETSKNEYTGRNVDVYKSDNAEFNIDKDGNIVMASVDSKKVFSDETKNSIELAKKYLNLLMPDFQYDYVSEEKYGNSDYYMYTFFKKIGDIKTSECVMIDMNSKGELECYIACNIGKFNNVEISGVNLDDLLRTVEKNINETYGNILVSYRIGDFGPQYSIYTDNKVELSIPVEVDVCENGNEYTITDVVIFTLN